MKSKKYNIFGKNLTIKLLFTVIFIGIVFVLYNLIDYFLKSTKIIEGISPTTDDIVTCQPTTTLSCGTDNTPASTYTPNLGTCDENYGPESSNYNPTLLSYCVDEPIPDTTTPSGNLNDSTNNDICTNLNYTRSRIMNVLTYTRPDGTTCLTG